MLLDFWLGLVLATYFFELMSYVALTLVVIKISCLMIEKSSYKFYITVVELHVLYTLSYISFKGLVKN